MHPCPSCRCHVRRTESECPHCGSRLKGGAKLHGTLLSAMLAVAVACAGDKDETDTGTPTDDSGLPQPLYGIPATADED